MVDGDEALFELLAELKSRDYRFTCVTPATHERVLARGFDRAPTLRDIFGWSRAFSVDEIEPKILRLLEEAGCVDRSGERLRSKVRVASLEDQLFLHSAFPTSEADAVFFGPDTYRFVRFVLGTSGDLHSPKRIVDLGSGSGVGGIAAAARLRPQRVTLLDINPAAARLAAVNARFAGIDAEVELSGELPSGCDLVIANPPYMMDKSKRVYRDGGGMLGGEVALRWASQCLEALESRGTLLLYAGAVFVEGKSPLVDAIADLCASAAADLNVEEIDPDVFGEELDDPGYRDVERIAALGMSIRKA